MADHRRTGRPLALEPWRALGVLAGAGLFALLAFQGLHTARTCIEAIAYPFELDYGEGPILSQTLRLMAGEAIYPPLGEPPYTISNYPPLYHLLSGVFGLWVGDTLAAGRMVSLASAVLIAVLIAWLVHRIARPAAGAPARLLAAGIAALLFLRASYTAVWAPLMRVDLLADLFALAGVVVFTAARGGERRAVAAAAFFLLALFTKQSTAAAVAACLLVAAVRERGAAARLLLVLLAGGLPLLVLLVLAGGGGFYFHVVTANQNEFSWIQALAFLQDLARRHPAELALAAVAAPRLLAGLRPGAGGDQASWARNVLGAYLITSFLVCLTAGKIGSEINYLIEHVAVLSICVGVTLADAFVPGDGRRTGFSATAIPLLLLLQVATAEQRGAVESTEAPPAPARQATRRVLEKIRAASGPVLSEDMTLLVLAGKPIEFQPFEMTQLARQGLWDPSPVLRRFANGDFALIVLRFDAAAPPGWKFRRFPQAMLKLIRSRYALVGNIDGYWLYEPRVGAGEAVGQLDRGEPRLTFTAHRLVQPREQRSERANLARREVRA